MEEYRVWINLSKRGIRIATHNNLFWRCHLHEKTKCWLDIFELNSWCVWDFFQFLIECFNVSSSERAINNSARKYLLRVCLQGLYTITCVLLLIKSPLSKISCLKTGPVGFRICKAPCNVKQTRSSHPPSSKCHLGVCTQSMGGSEWIVDVKSFSVRWGELRGLKGGQAGWEEVKTEDEMQVMFTCKERQFLSLCPYTCS